MDQLRKVLRNFNKFDPHEIDSAVLLLELRDALGFNPNKVPAVTKRQREVIVRHLIEDRASDEAARMLGLGSRHDAQKGRRQLFLVERAGLEAILVYLQGGRMPYQLRQWRPWELAQLDDTRYTVSELATKLGRSEVAVKLMRAKLRKRHDYANVSAHARGRVAS